MYLTFILYPYISIFFIIFFHNFNIYNIHNITFPIFWLPFVDAQILRFFLDLYFFKFIIYGFENPDIEFFFFNKFNDGIIFFNDFFSNVDFFFLKGKEKFFSYYFIYVIYRFILFLIKNLKLLPLRRNIYFKIYHFYSKFGIFSKFHS